MESLKKKKKITVYGIINSHDYFRIIRNKYIKLYNSSYKKPYKFRKQKVVVFRFLLLVMFSTIMRLYNNLLNEKYAAIVGNDPTSDAFSRAIKIPIFRTNR